MSESLTAADLFDQVGQVAPASRERVFSGAIFDVVRDRVDLGEGGGVTREYVVHPGAVTVLAMRGEPGAEEVLFINQYRHALGVTDWELPAGLLDVAGEPAWEAAARELAEEADLVASTWHTLAGYAPSPGASDEAVRIFLARDVSPVPQGERHVRTGEEAGIRVGWVDLDLAYAAVLAGRLCNPGLQVGVLAAHGQRARGWADLRPADAPWREHPAHR